MLGWFEASQEQINKLLPFINNAIIYPLSEPVILQTIELRRKHKIKTPDSIIAATALVNKLILISHNNKDFKAIQGLDLIDPHSL
jgi:predicted nucleic acid-binding protein